MDYDISVDGALNSFSPTLDDSEFNLIGKYNQIENLSDFEVIFLFILTLLNIWKRS